VIPRRLAGAYDALMGRNARWGAVVVAGLIAACGDGGGAGSKPSDAIVVADAAPADAARPPDAAVAHDAAPADAAAVADATPRDAAPIRDAAPPPPDAARPADAAPVPDAAPAADAAPTDDAAPAPDASAPRTAASCFQFANPNPLGGPDYDQFHPVVGSHCMGTNHQDIHDVERVVFLGDSITVGTPPTPSDQFYRSRLAERLAVRFHLPQPNPLWREVNLIDGVALLQDDGTFASCARYGARTDDLMQDRQSVEDCLPEDQRGRRTLVIITMGGNDLDSLTQHALQGASVDELWAQTRDFVQLMSDAVHWIKEPGRFPNGVYVIFANMYEYTDGTGDVQSCPAAGIAGLGGPLPDAQALADMVIWANEQYMRIAVETGSDMIFLLENFCGHGYHHDDPNAPCYRGPNTEQWFDLTCIHPNPAGHQAISDMFMAVVGE
jgi:lysophospholipase L1-like esterase